MEGSTGIACSKKSVIIEISVREAKPEENTLEFIKEKANSNYLIIFSKGLPNKSDENILLSWLSKEVLVELLGVLPERVIFLRK